MTQYTRENYPAYRSCDHALRYTLRVGHIGYLKKGDYDKLIVAFEELREKTSQMTISLCGMNENV